MNETGENSIAKCEELFDSLLGHLSALKKMRFNKQAYLADIEAVGKSQEVGFNKGGHRLKITHYDNDKAITPLLNSYTELMRRTSKSSLFVKRYAGFLVVDYDHPCIQLTEAINRIKDAISLCVRDVRFDNGEMIIDADGKPVHHRNHQQKHEFIHKAIPNVITAQCYRHIPVVCKDVRRISFYWGAKHVHKILSHEKAIEHISYWLDFLGKNQLVTSTLSDLDEAADMQFFLPKLQKNAVMATANFNDGTRKNFHCTVPLIIASKNTTDIKYEYLADHDPTPQEFKPNEDTRVICPETNLHARPHRTRDII